MRWLSIFRTHRSFLLLVSLISIVGIEQSASQEQSDGQQQIRALQQSYPQVVTGVSYRDGDWSIELGDRRFYWAHARFLPETERNNYERYSSIRFYRYYRGPVQLATLTLEQETRVRQLFAERSSASPSRTSRHNDFLDTLYGIRNRTDADRKMIQMRFLGHAVTVHPFLRSPLHRVEQKILRRIARDTELRAFIAEIHSVSGYVWRPISGTNTRSYHGYGAAVDLLHNNYEGDHVYWRWSAERGVEEWWKIPVADRWSPPPSMIDIFESEGFVWGGKWLLFDNLHFEYRPEVLSMVKP